MMRQILLIASLTLLASCGGRDSSPTSPSPDLFATGTWQGPLTLDNTGGAAGTIRLVLTEDASGSVTGTATVSAAPATLPTGAVTGGLQPGATPPTAIGLAITFGGACPITLSAPSTFSSRTTLDGAIAGGNPSCGIDISGHFTLQKQ